MRNWLAQKIMLVVVVVLLVGMGIYSQRDRLFDEINSLSLIGRQKASYIEWNEEEKLDRGEKKQLDGGEIVLIGKLEEKTEIGILVDSDKGPLIFSIPSETTVYETIGSESKSPVFVKSSFDKLKVGDTVFVVYKEIQRDEENLTEVLSIGYQRKF